VPTADGRARRPENFHASKRDFKLKVSILIHVKQAPQPQSDSLVVGASVISPEGAKNHQFESH